MSQTDKKTASQLVPNGAPPLSRNGTWRTYSAVGGLSSLYCEHIAQDTDGFVWVGTTDFGACRFDGDEFRRFTREDGLCGNEVFSILLARDGRLFFGTLDGGACWYDGHRFEQPAGEAPQSVTFLYQDRQDRIWCGGPNTLGYFQGETYCDLQDLPGAKTDNCQGIVQDQQGHIWFGFRGYLLHFDGVRFYTEATGDGSDDCFHVAVDSAGVLWVSWDGAIWPYSTARLQGPGIQLGALTRKMQTDRSGRLWALAPGFGACYWEDGRLQALDIAAGLPNDQVTGVFLDREGLLWFATFGGGPICYDPQSLFEVKSPAPLPQKKQDGRLERVNRLVHDPEGRIWTLPPIPPIWEFDQPNLNFYDGCQYQRTQIRAFCLGLDLQGQVLAGVQGGVLRFCGTVAESLAIELDDSWKVTAILAGTDNDLYLGLAAQDEDGTGGSVRLAHYQQGDLQVLWEVKQPYLMCVSKMISGGAKDLWLQFAFPQYASIQPHLERLGINAICGHWRAEGTMDLYGPHSDGTAADLKDISLDPDGSVWLVFLDGIRRLNGHRFEPVQLPVPARPSPMHTVLRDSRGYLWCGTRMGALCYNGQIVQVLNNLLQKSVNDLLEDPQGRLWAATGSGLKCYTPATVPPLIRLVRVVADRIYEGKEAILFCTATEQVVFEFKGMSCRTPPRDMHYTWRLQGQQQNWQRPVRQARAEFADLPVGQYLFEVKAIDRDFNESVPLRIVLEIQPDAAQERLDAFARTLASHSSDFVGSSDALQDILKRLSQAAPTNMTVLILGETGTGKGLAARALHGLSQRKNGPFIHVNCGAIPSELADSELFGHEKGAFTGATQRQLGRVELAQGGTLFLDEIGDMPVAIQVKLLHLLQERRFERVGGSRSLEADVRVVAATNRDLEAMMAAGGFRQDLYYRLQMYPVHLPPLRQRLEDIAPLAQHFVGRYAQHLNRPAPAIDTAALSRLCAYHWPGNVRELEYLMQRAVLQCGNGRIEVQQIARQLEGGNGAARGTAAQALSLAAHERRHIEAALIGTGWVIEGQQGAAYLLDIKPSTLRARMHKHGLKRPS